MVGLAASRCCLDRLHHAGLITGNSGHGYGECSLTETGGGGLKTNRGGPDGRGRLGWVSSLPAGK